MGSWQNLCLSKTPVESELFHVSEENSWLDYL